MFSVEGERCDRAMQAVVDLAITAIVLDRNDPPDVVMRARPSLHAYGDLVIFLPMRHVPHGGMKMLPHFSGVDPYGNGKREERQAGKGCCRVYRKKDGRMHVNLLA